MSWLTADRVIAIGTAGSLVVVAIALLIQMMDRHGERRERALDHARRLGVGAEGDDPDTGVQIHVRNSGNEPFYAIKGTVTFRSSDRASPEGGPFEFEVDILPGGKSEKFRAVKPWPKLSHRAIVYGYTFEDHLGRRFVFDGVRLRETRQRWWTRQRRRTRWWSR